MTNLFTFLATLQSEAWAEKMFNTLEVDAGLGRPPCGQVSRAELAQALNMILFDDLVQRVPAAQAYTDDAIAAGGRINFDHGALRTVLWASGALPPGEAAFTRILRPLGYRLNGHYPLKRLNMTGRSWCHADFPENIAQFFVSELHPEAFSGEFQQAVTRVLGTSTDPLSAADIGLLEQLDRDQQLPRESGLRLLPRLVACFKRQHEVFTLADYEILARESAEMAWIATEGNVFNHATDRVADVETLAEGQKRLGRPMKDLIEVSQSGRVRQTAFRAADVERRFLHNGALVTRKVPGSFYEFISRDLVSQADGAPRLDLQFDAGNATGIFGMTTQQAQAATA